MKKINKIILSILLIGVFCASGAQAEKAAMPPVTCAVYFTGVGCPHCAQSDPVVLIDLLAENPDLAVVEYEIYQEEANSAVFLDYAAKYELPLGVPLLLFSPDQNLVGDAPIIEGVEEILGVLSDNGCALVDGSMADFHSLNLDDLAGLPKIWHGDNVLIKTGDGGKSDLLRKLLLSEDIASALAEENADYEEAEPQAVALSGQSVDFNHAIKLTGWILQWREAEGEENVNESAVVSTTWWLIPFLALAVLMFVYFRKK